MANDDEDFLPSSSSAEYWQSADHGRRDALRKAIEKKTGISISQGDMDAKTALDLLKLQAMLAGDDDDEKAAIGTDPSSQEPSDSDEPTTKNDEDRERIDHEHERKIVEQESAQEHQSDAG